MRWRIRLPRRDADPEEATRAEAVMPELRAVEQRLLSLVRDVPPSYRTAELRVALLEETTRLGTPRRSRAILPAALLTGALIGVGALAAGSVADPRDGPPTTAPGLPSTIPAAPSVTPSDPLAESPSPTYGSSAAPPLDPTGLPPGPSQPAPPSSAPPEEPPVPTPPVTPRPVRPPPTPPIPPSEVPAPPTWLPSFAP